MKKFYLSLMTLILLTICFAETNAQYLISSTSITNSLDSSCHGPTAIVHTNMYSVGQTVENSWGDGSHDTVTVNNQSGMGHMGKQHIYTSAGTYTIKHVLLYNNQRVDSAIQSYFYQFCKTVFIGTYNDVNNNCIYDTLTEKTNRIALTLEVDSNNVAIDTVDILDGLYYTLKGFPGTIYKFKVIDAPQGVQVTCPANQTISDTIAQFLVNDYMPKSFGINCTAVPGFDLAEHVSGRAGLDFHRPKITITNSNCNVQNPTLTMHYSPKYSFVSSSPAPASNTGQTLTWNLNNISMINQAQVYTSFVLSGPATAGDTIHTTYYLTPTTGDIDTTNNMVIIIDTIHQSCDPNHKEVLPEGDILAGTTLRYVIEFENVGNAPAQNIHILDTLSNNVILGSLKILSSTHKVYYTKLEDGLGHSIAKFDFPAINLPDTSHHDSCSGNVIYTIQTKPGLPDGTYITNRAGIYFDFNDVVMTNEATNVIGIPQSVNTLSNVTHTNLYPNPVADILTINTDATVYNSVEISNTIGQLMLQQNIKQNETKVNVKTLPAGIYFATLKGEGGSKTIKFEKL